MPKNLLAILNVPNVFPTWDDSEFVDVTKSGSKSLANRFADVHKV
jgi:hypothetical protein